MTSSTPPPFPGLPTSKAPTPPTPPRPGGMLPRMGARASDNLAPMHDQVARIDLRLIGASLYDLIDVQVVDFDPHDIDPFMKALEANRERVDQLRQQADAYWEAHAWKGAILVYNWNDATLGAIQTRLGAFQQEQVALRVTDPLLALNLLGRARGSLLLPRSPVALERAFLNRSIASDDPRIIRLAQEAGCAFAPLVDPAPETDEPIGEDDSA